MRTIPFSRFLVCLSLLLLAGPLYSQSIAIPISELEADIITRNPNTTYVYCGAKFAEIIAQLTDLDHNHNSLLHKFNKHITRGSRLAEYNAVVETLAYAENFLQKNKQLNSDQLKEKN